MKLIHTIINKFGPRPSGSLNELKTANLLLHNFSKYGDSIIQKLHCHPNENYFWLHVSNILFLFGIIINNKSLISLLLVSLSFFNFIIHRIFNIKLFNFLFQKKESCNVITTIKPKNKNKQTIIFCAHHDSGKITKLLNTILGNYLLHMDIMLSLISYIIFFVNIFINISFLLIIPIIKIIISIYISFNMFEKQYSVGANDNLSGVQVLLNIAKKAKTNNTEIKLISFGSEEIGCIGSKDYVKKHYKDIKDSLVINFESVGCGNYFTFMNNERYFINYDKNLKYEFLKILKLNNNKISNNSLSKLGVSDAGPFAEKNISAITIISIDKNGQIPNWHSHNDIFKNVKEDNINKLTKASLDFIKKIDNNLP
jgi:hypothetical protein